MFFSTSATAALMLAYQTLYDYQTAQLDFVERKEALKETLVLMGLAVPLSLHFR